MIGPQSVSEPEFCMTPLTTKHAETIRLRTSCRSEPLNVGAVRSKPQVAPDHYVGSYLNLPRMITYWYQAAAVRDCGGRDVLEIGLGMGLVSWILRKWGFCKLRSLDLDAALGPTCAGDVRAMPFADDSFDTILIAEVLEHLPFDQFVACLRELHRVSRRHVVVTLPCPLFGVHVGINLPILEPFFVAIGTRQWSRPRFDGQHYWELDRLGYPKRRIRKAIGDAGLNIEKEFRPGLSLYNYFFVLEKRSAISTQQAG